MEEKITAANVQVANITAEKGYQVVSEADLIAVVAGLDA